MLTDYQEEAPALLDRGSKRKSRGGVSGVRSDPSARKLGRWCLRRWRILVQSPRVAALFQLRDRMIGDRVSFILCQLRLQPLHDLAGPPQGEGEGISKDFTSCHFSIRTYRERMYKPLHLVPVIWRPARR
jgi:hypothetical protein